MMAVVGVVDGKVPRNASGGLRLDALVGDGVLDVSVWPPEGVRTRECTGGTWLTDGATWSGSGIRSIESAGGEGVVDLSNGESLRFLGGDNVGEGDPEGSLLLPADDDDGL